ncbi:MAG: beta-lactamase family protein [Azoarcus sp.]|jgi:CubicO group peptidase (beta-lactamase class C family)|nr:beta-lactamase family protein [Azoarcus sp.]
MSGSTSFQHALRRAATFAALAATLAIAACSNAPQRPATLQTGDYRYALERTRWLIEQEMKQNQVTGLSIALVDDQRVLWAEGFGFEDAKGALPASATTPYRLGSIAKVVTATAAMQLAERGQLDIDRPLADALPGFAMRSRFDSPASVTPRNIMTHHSGLPINYLNGMLTAGTPEPFTHLVEAVRNEYVAYPPEFIFSYSNLGVTLLGAAIERRAGESYAGFVDRNLFGPLGMGHSRFEPRPDLKVYDHGRQIEPLGLRDLPSGGLVSTVEDMSRFMSWLFAQGRNADGARLLSSASLDEMFRVQNEDVALDMGFKVGLGWLLSGIEIQGAGIVASHGGTLLDSHSLMVVLPEHRLGVIVAANSATAQNVVKAVATEALTLALEAKTGILQPPAARPASAESTVMTPAELARYESWYDSMVGLVRVSPASNALDAKVMGHTLQLRPRGTGEFGLRYKLFGMFPVQVAAFEGIRISMRKIAEHDVLVGHFGANTMLIGERLSPTPVPASLFDFLGEYELSDDALGIIPEHLSLNFEHGLLIGECRFTQLPGFVLRIGLTPISEHEILISGLGTGKGETIVATREDDGHVLRFSGLELRRKNPHLARR